MFMVDGSSDKRLLLTMYPAELNSLSQGTDVAGTHRAFFASRANVGNNDVHLSSTIEVGFHHPEAFSPP